MLTRIHRLPRSLRRFLLMSLFGLLLTTSLPLVPTIAQPSPVPALTAIEQGQREFEQGNFQAALTQWQQAEVVYRQEGNQTGAIGSRMNQAKAWQRLGFYRRAKSLLADTFSSLPTEAITELKGNLLLEYGNILRLVGETAESQRVLRQGVAIAQQLRSLELLQAAQLYLGNAFLAAQQPHDALPQFQQAATQPGPLQLTAQLRQLKVVAELNQSSDAIALLPAISTHLNTLPPSQLTLYAHIELAALLSSPNLYGRFANRPFPPSANRPFPPSANRPFPPSANRPFPPSADHSYQAKLLATAVQQAKTLGNQQGESYAIGRLGALYEQTGQWAEAQQLTQTALQLARQVNVPEILYQWHWQLGRILQAQGRISAAKTAYTDAIQILRSLRQDLTALAPDVQFSFRDQVEPVYRELVDLLLKPDASQADLQQARQVVESLQLAELNDFFREACLDPEARPVDNIDPTAAVIYPVILRDRLEVILSIPGQPLRHAATPLPQAEVEAGIQRMRAALRRTAFLKERLAALGQMYQWLIQPIAADLTQHSIQTLVFVLDGSLRNLPMAALHDGKQYLIEQYQIAITPSLQLMSPRKTAAQEPIRALVAGLSEGTSDSVPLPGVKQEVEMIQQKLPAQVLLNQAFTSQILTSKLNSTPYNLVHLATHGKFGSNAEETYIQTWDGRVTVNDLQRLLNQRSLIDQSFIELLVLSACQTAEGDRRAALGMAGLAVRSGARTTLATLWAVDDASTVRFITEFYKQLTQLRSNKAQSVRAAQLALLQSKEFNHPFFWAPFILVGSWL